MNTPDLPAEEPQDSPENIPDNPVDPDQQGDIDRRLSMFSRVSSPEPEKPEQGPEPPSIPVNELVELEQVPGSSLLVHAEEGSDPVPESSASANETKPITPVSSTEPGEARRMTSLPGQKTAAKSVNRSQGSRPSASGVEAVPIKATRPAGSARQSRRPGSNHPFDPSGRGINPGLQLSAIEASTRSTPASRLSLKYRLRPTRETTRRAAWDVAAVTSLVINAILAGALLLMAFQIRNLKAAANGVFGGLYGSLVEMDNASIATNITVDTQIPLNFNLPLQQSTDMSLTRNVVIPGAYFLLNGSPVPVNVTLPEGTILPVALNMNLPVQVTVPVSMQVPINIPINQTQLHNPFISLQNIIRPLYCVLDKNAQYPQGVYICGENTETVTAVP